MVQFYARYVPPPSKPVSSEEVSVAPESRKRKAKSEPKIKNKKQKLEADNDTNNNQEAFRSEEQTLGSGTGPGDSLTTDPAHLTTTASGESVISKYRVTTTATKNEGEVKIHQKNKPVTSNSEHSEQGTARNTTKSERRNKKEKEHKPEGPKQDEHDVSHEDPPQKHAGLLSKFKKVKIAKQLGENTERSMQNIQPTEIHGLEPIPQPEATAVTSERPSYSTLAAWQSEALKVVHGTSRKFSDFPISQAVVSNLKKHALQESLPVQTTVLPLLLNGEDFHEGDVCVSAATGSGKTLAYVVPMVESLRQYQSTELRGVIIVPTRELVQQVRQLCEICAAGTNLKIATAAGSKSIKEEQKILLTEDEVYDPEEYEKQQNAQIDWTTFSIEKLMREVQENNRLVAVNFVKRFRSNVDILIATPGRLVDHLRSTDGFNLDHVSWLVVDEADRLLNESYQEWIDTVTPALLSQAATQKRDEVLRHMRMNVPKRAVKKVLLSATMTKDISKLNSLGLQNPKLVVLGSAQLEQRHDQKIQADNITADSQPGTEREFHLPPSMSEFAVGVRDGYEKPLYLLQLLQSRIILPSLKDTAQETGLDADELTSSTSDDSDSSTSSSGVDDICDTSSSASSLSSATSPGRSTSFISKSSRKQNKDTSFQSSPKVLIFTRSTSSATRLSRLLSLLSPNLTLSTLTRSTSASASSRRSLKSFLSGKSSILIATDRASRGLDISNLTHVISYDVPASALTYVHRVGRTARAGKEGSAWTMVEHREGKWFWEEIGGKGKRKGGEEMIVRWQGKKVKRVEVTLEGEWGGDEGRQRYEDALGKLGEEVRRST